MIEKVYLCIETHPDSLIEAAFHTLEAAKAFCDEPANLTDTGHPKYRILTIHMEDFKADEIS